MYIFPNEIKETKWTWKYLYLKFLLLFKFKYKPKICVMFTIFISLFDSRNYNYECTECVLTDNSVASSEEYFESVRSFINGIILKPE